MRLVTGYPGGNDVTFAIERGGITGTLWMVMDQREDESFRLAQGWHACGAYPEREHPDLLHIPLVMDTFLS